MYGQFPIAVIFFFGIDVNNVNFIVLVVIEVFWLPCFFFIIIHFYYLLLSWEAFTLYPSPVLLQVLTQQATISMRCALETSLNNTKWF